MSSTWPVKNKLIGVPLKYGLFGGALVIVLFLLFYLLGKNPLTEIEFIDDLMVVVFVFFAIKEFRDRHNHRELHFWQGVSAGMITYFTIAIVSALFVLLLLFVIDPDLLGDYIENKITLLNENKDSLIKNINEKAYSEALVGVRHTTPLDLAIDDFLKKSIIGLFLTVIIAVILRK
jgi:hypothetical protein